MILTDFDQLAKQDVLSQIYGSFSDMKALAADDKTAMLNQIVNILERGYSKYNECDKALIQKEEIIRVLLGIDFSAANAPLPYVKLREILTTPMQEIMRQMERVPSTKLNLSTLRTVFALIINGEAEEMASSLSKTFPQYFRQMLES